MKRVFAWVAALAMLISSSFNVMASGEVSISDGDLTAESATTKDVEVGVDKGSTFTVSVPIIPPINEESYKAMERSDGFFSDCLVTGDIASNEQIVVSVDEDVVLSPDGGLKDSVTWKAHTIPSASTGQDLNSTNIENGKTKTIGVKLSKDMPAGLWRGYLHVNVAVDTYGAVLTAEQFKTLIGNSDSEVNISIPKYVEIDGVQTLVRGIGEGALSGYPNLAVVNLETDEEFYFEDSFKGLSTSADTVVINGNSNVVKVSGVTQLSTKITFSNCTLYVNGNPYVDSISDMIDMSAARYVSDIHGSFTELSLNERSLFIDTDCMTNASVDKLVVPEFVFNCVKSAAFRGSGVKEVEVSNDIVGDSWFEDCKDLTKVVLKDGVTTIRNNAFSGCTNLTDVEVPETVTAIGAGAFDNTPFLDKIKNNGDGTINGIPVTEVKKKSELIYSEDGKTLIKIPTDFEGIAEIKDGVTKIASGAIENNSYDKVTLVKIPSSVKEIEGDGLSNLNNNFAATKRIELNSSNNAFWVANRMSFTNSDETGIEAASTDCTLLVSATYRNVDNKLHVEGNYKVYDDGVVGIEFDEGKSAAQPMYTSPTDHTFTLNGNGETVVPIYYNKDTNAVQELKWYNATTPDYVEVDSLIADGATYYVQCPTYGILFFNVDREISSTFKFAYVNDDVGMGSVNGDEVSGMASPYNYSGDLAIRRGVSQVGDTSFDNKGTLKTGLKGLCNVTIPNTVREITADYLLSFNEYAKSIVLESDNNNFILIGNDTQYTLKQKLCVPDRLGAMSGTGTYNNKYVVEYGVVRTQKTSVSTNIPVTFNPVWLEAGAYTLGGADPGISQYELVNTDASGKPISSFGNNGVMTVNWGENVTIGQNSYLFITPICNNYSTASRASALPLSESVILKKAPTYSPDGSTLLSVPSDYEGELSLLATCTTIADDAFNHSDWVDDNSVYEKITRITIPKSVTTISDTELSHINAMFGEDERVQVQDGNTIFTVMSGTNGTDTDRQVIRASDSYKPVQKMSWMDCDGVVYAHTRNQTGYDLAVKPVYFAEGSYTITAGSSSISGFSFVATKSSGSRYVLSGASEDDDLLYSSDGTINLTVPSGGLFIWTNITSKQGSFDSSRVYSFKFNGLFTVTKN